MKLTPHIRWMTRDDIRDVMEIEQLCFGDPWTQSELDHVRRTRNCCSMVSELNGQVSGHLLYLAMPTCYEIMNIAVHPSCWRLGIGSAMVDYLKAKLMQPHSQKKTRVQARVADYNLDGQKFFRAMGFSAMDVLPKAFDGDIDAYRFAIYKRDLVAV